MKERKADFKVVTMSLDGYVAEMKQDSTKIKPFWYFDAHSNNYLPSPETKDFLEKNFYIENNYDGFQAWTKHFILLKDVPSTVDISNFIPLKETNGDPIAFNMESFQNANNIVQANGWAF